MDRFRRLAGTWMVAVLALLAGCVGNDSPSPVVLTGLQITPAAVSKPAGIAQQYVATATYSDGHTQIVTSSVAWRSSDGTKATIDNLGVARTLAPGTTTITAVSGVTGSNTALLTVTAAELVSIQTTPATAGKPAGLTQQYAATGTYSDATTVDLTATVSWTSSDRTIAAIGLGGTAQALSPGVASIAATLDGKTSTPATLTVTAATLVALQVTPPVVSKAVGIGQQYAAIGTYTDGSSQDLSSAVNWASSDTGKATIDPDGLAHTVSPGVVGVNATRGGLVSNTAILTVTAAEVVTIQLSPAAASVPLGLTRQYTAMATFTDARTQDVTGSVGWSASDTSQATIGTSGLATAVAVGTPTIRATLGGVQSNAGVLTVTPAVLLSIQVTPPAVSKALGTSQQYTASGAYSDHTNRDITAAVSWASSVPVHATITPTGLATAVSSGASVVTATLDGIGSNASTFTASTATLTAIQITPGTAARASGTTQPYVATGRYSDGTTQDLTTTVAWSSSLPAIATIDATGLATTLAVGDTVVTATLGGVTSNAGGLHVSPAVLVAIQLSPATVGKPLGLTQQYVATGHYSDGTNQDLTTTVAWTSSDTGRATIDGTGLATTIAMGTTTISASSNGVVSNAGTLNVTAATVTAIQVNPGVATVPQGLSQQYTATGTYTDQTTADVSTNVAWSSSSLVTATIDANGLATAAASSGQSHITASLNGVTSNTSTLNASSPALTSIVISPSTATKPIGLTQQYNAMGTFSDGHAADITTAVYWVSGETNKATIDANGLATAIAVGMPHLAALYGGLVSQDAILTVTPAAVVSIAVTPTSASIAAGLTRQFMAIGTYSDGTTQNVSTSAAWLSADTTVVTIDTNGLATSSHVGVANVTAASGGVTSNTAALTVTAATLTAITVTPATATQNTGSGQQYLAVGVYTDGTNQDVTTSVSWTSSNTSVATIAASGLASAISSGTAGIVATRNSVSSNTGTLTVTLPSTTPTGALNFARIYHHGVLLDDGTALIAGGLNGIYVDVAPAETYDPSTGAWTVTGNMVQPRHDFAMAKMSDGTVLAIGGAPNGNITSGAERYDPATRTWTAIASMGTGRYEPSATLLADGRLLVASGLSGNNPTPTCEIFDPVLGSWSATGSMALGRISGRATRLPDGRVLVSGGSTNSGATATAEIYDPSAGTWSAAGSMTVAFDNHVQTLLNDGTVLAVGSAGAGQVYAPSTNTWTAMGNQTFNRTYGGIALLPNGTVFLAGGLGNAVGTSLYDPATGTFSAGPNMTNSRYLFDAILLNNGRVLLPGGYDTSTGATSAVDLY